jgi:hypothetical protein
MMLAMAWMYAFIHGLLLPGHSSMHLHTDMDMAGGDVSAAAESPGWVTAINWFWFVGFVVAAVFWTFGFGAKRPDGPTYRWWRWLVTPAQATMAARCLSCSAPRFLRPEPGSRFVTVPASVDRCPQMS